jgi:hypothetical protein
MHIPAYALDEIHDSIPSALNLQQAEGTHCCFCNSPFPQPRLRVPLRSAEGLSLNGCRPCLTALVARVRRQRDSNLTEQIPRPHLDDLIQGREEQEYLNSLMNATRAAKAVTRLLADKDLSPQEVAWVAVALESAFDWATSGKERLPCLADSPDSPFAKTEVCLYLEMSSAREFIAHRLVYHVLNESSSPEPEMCEEFECPADCSGRHEFDHIDCGPDEIFDALARHGVELPEEGS